MRRVAEVGIFRESQPEQSGLCLCKFEVTTAYGAELGTCVFSLVLTLLEVGQFPFHVSRELGLCCHRSSIEQ